MHRSEPPRTVARFERRQEREHRFHLWCRPEPAAQIASLIRLVSDQLASHSELCNRCLRVPLTLSCNPKFATPGDTCTIRLPAGLAQGRPSSDHAGGPSRFREPTKLKLVGPPTSIFMVQSGHTKSTKNTVIGGLAGSWPKRETINRRPS